MSRAENVELARRWLDAWNANDRGELDKLYHRDFVFHSRPPGLAAGIEGEKQILDMLHTAFPDLVMSMEAVVADNELVAVRWRMPATHTGPFRGIPATGRSVVQTGIDILSVDGGKITGRWDEVNRLETLVQMGVMSAL
jgi:steroid delta-isomerase-like uncharacterized protein